jgi:hypothetical protein
LGNAKIQCEYDAGEKGDTLYGILAEIMDAGDDMAHQKSTGGEYKAVEILAQNISRRAVALQYILKIGDEPKDDVEDE